MSNRIIDTTKTVILTSELIEEIITASLAVDRTLIRQVEKREDGSWVFTLHDNAIIVMPEAPRSR